MRSSLVLAAVLCFASVVHAAYGPVAMCCLRWSTARIPLQSIKGYTIQTTGDCPINAVMLKTKRGKTLCSDPNSAWAIRAMQKVDEEAKNKALQEQERDEDGTTSNTTPAPSTEKVTTEGRQTWKETEVEEVQEREDVTEEMSHGPVAKRCCLKWSTTRIPLERIVNYTIQSEGACPVKAIMLKTTQGKTLCSDPNSAWAIRAMRKVDEEAKNKALQEQERDEGGTTSNTTPAASTVKVTTEGRQTWKETEEVQEREDVAEEMSHGPVGKPCCLQWSTTRIPLEQIVNYTIQSEEACPVRAIILKTTQGKTLCSDPNSAWAIRAMRKVDEETKNKALQEQERDEDGTTSKTTPAPSTVKVTTEGRQTWKETETEEEREDVAEEMCEDSQDKSTKITPPRVLMYCINNKQT